MANIPLPPIHRTTASRPVSSQTQNASQNQTPTHNQTATTAQGNQAAASSPAAAKQTRHAEVKLQPQTPLPPQTEKQLQAGQQVQTRVLPPQTNQPPNQVTVQTSSGSLLLLSGNTLPPANSTATLTLAPLPQQAATNSVSIADRLVLTWQAATQQNNPATILPGQSPSQQSTLGSAHAGSQSSLTSVFLNSLQGAKINATTLTANSLNILATAQKGNPNLLNTSQQGGQIGQIGQINSGIKGNVGQQAGQQGNIHNQQTVGQFPPKHQMNVRILNVSLPGQPNNFNIQAAQNANAFQATVLSSQTGTTLVQTANGPLSLPLPQPLPIGTNLTLAPLSNLTPLPIESGIGQFSMEKWAHLKEAMSQIQAGNPQLAQQILQALPSPNNQMAVSMLFLLSSLRGGAVENWLGKNGALRAGSTGERITDILRNATKAAKDVTGQDWRAYAMPIVQPGGDMGELWLYLKDKPDDDQQSSKQDDEAKRFIVETNFQSTGPIQLDGMATKKTLELMFRSLSPLDENMRDKIRALFGTTTMSLGLTGTIRFHVSQDFPVTITESSEHNPTANITI